MPDEQRTLAAILDDIAGEALASGDQRILDLVEEVSDLLGFERGERYYVDKAMRHVVEVTTEGYQVLDTRTEVLLADVWASRGKAQAACDALNGVACAPAAPAA